MVAGLVLDAASPHVAFTETGDLFAYLGSLFGAHGFCDTTALYDLSTQALSLAILALAATPLPAKFGKTLRQKLQSKPALLLILELVWFLGLFAVCIAYLVDSTYNPFIYFRF